MSELTGRELDAAVAEAMGWNTWYWEIEHRRLFQFTPPNDTGVPSYWQKTSYESGGEIVDRELPHYSTDIADAWKLVEELRTRNIAITLSTCGPRSEVSAYTTYNGQNGPITWASTAPLAISQTFLKALEAAK